MTKIFFILLGFTLQTMAFAQTSPFQGGSGSASDPYQISTATQLNSVRNYLNSCFILMNNIDLGVAPYNTGDGWIPIGNNTNKFTGHFNGKGHSCHNLYINQPAGSYLGLFGYIDHARIDSLGMEDFNITGDQYLGGLIGMSAHDTINKCYGEGTVSGNNNVGGLIGKSNTSFISNSYTNITISGNENAGGLIGSTFSSTTISCSSGGIVSGNGENIGGLVGYNEYSDITSCYALNNVTGNNNDVGGLVGFNNQGTVAGCYAKGNVWGLDFVGGLVGENNLYSNITTSYATGSVTGRKYVGGLLGYLGNYSIVNRCYATGSVYGSEYMVGGLVGTGLGNCVTTDCYSTGNASGDHDIGGFIGLHQSNCIAAKCYTVSLVTGNQYLGSVTGSNSEATDSCYFNFEVSGMGDEYASGLTTTQMKGSAIFTGWDFEYTWTIRTDSTYPGLRLLNNAPFAFGDVFELINEISLSTLLHNDYDIETKQTALVMKVMTLYGAGSINASGWYTFPADSALGYTDSLLYRVGEVLTVGDTLWGNTAKAIFIKVGNTAPVITSTAPVIAAEGVQYTYSVIATDAEGDILTYSLSGEPTGMMATGNVITWTPAAGTTTSGNVTLTVSDGGLTDTETFTITVSTSGSTAVTNTRQANINVCPNPVNDKLNIQLRADDLPAIIRVYSFDGKQVLLQETNSSLTEVEMENLHSGIFILKIATPAQTIEKKIIKQ